SQHWMHCGETINLEWSVLIDRIDNFYSKHPQSSDDTHAKDNASYDLHGVNMIARPGAVMQATIET
ncbi:MAG TPA: hypothetical protein VFP71_14800, partial [Candidatus Angelobacter sp.]|nr:hypothetical protein [Candidatus Angelobacter sp.]